MNSPSSWHECGKNFSPLALASWRHQTELIQTNWLSPMASIAGLVVPSTSLLVVQFPHPGGEHGPDAAGVKGWNRGDHRRKFLKAPGRWRTTPSLTEGDENGELVFWGSGKPAITSRG